MTACYNCITLNKQTIDDTESALNAFVFSTTFYAKNIDAQETIAILKLHR